MATSMDLSVETLSVDTEGFTLTVERAPYGKRFEGARGGPGEGLYRGGGICERRVVAGRGGENFFSFYRFSC